jgi:23S rRNA pseudouridine2605 synthase
MENSLKKRKMTDKFKRAEEKKFRKPFKKNFKKPSSKPLVNKRENDDGELIRLNRYIANAGICSRREADKLIASGAVSVNGKIVTEMGTKISRNDSVNFGGETLKKEKMVYVLLNKPKDYITTTDDPDGRKTVMALVRNACRERIYPVGRLDRATTGLLLMTNDGEMAKKLMHPKHGVKKIYHVELDNNLSRTDMDKIFQGIELEDGRAQVDEIAYDGAGADKKSIGLELHAGKNRIVRRIFESLGYKVVRLDRVYYAGLTKKDLPRGKWRFLTQIEINMLKMIS